MDINALRVLTRVRAIMEAGEEATDAADATAFCTTAASTRNAKTSVLPFFAIEVVVVAVVVATARCRWGATITELKPN